MSHPFLWPNKIFYYPIGNTAPVCLTQGLPPEENAKILLLGCGDPRNILYTLYASVKCPSKPRSLDFTCCDLEPAVLARNVLLFTLAVDGCPTTRIWNIFYHFKLDKASLTLLVKQCQKLLSISGDLEAWSDSQYSTFLRVCNRHTLIQLRRHWELYVRAAGFSKEKNDRILAMFSSEYKNYHGSGSAIHFSSSRSAGPFTMDAIKIQLSHFEHYWRTGTIFSNAKDLALAKLLNPTFIYSVMGEGCHFHYGSYPLQNFHLLAAFVPEHKSGKSVTIDDLIACAQTQFKEWCDTFKRAVVPTSHKPVVVRLIVSDALAFCHTLRNSQTTGSTSASRFVSSFSAVELVLDGGDYGAGVSRAAPTAFNVIDTSNITDHAGLLNVLIAAVPLLIHGSSSTLYTESLLVDDDKDYMKAIVQRLCTDINVISLLFGIAPVDYLSGFDSHSNVHEILMGQVFHDANKKQYHERIKWKIPYLGDTIVLHRLNQDRLLATFDPVDLAKLLFDIYYHMFQHEDVFGVMKNPKKAINIIHYDRSTFAALLGLVKSRVQTDWRLVMENILDMLHTDKRIVLGSNFYQDLCCQLHIRGVYSVEIYQMPPTISFGKTVLFHNWVTVPPVVCLLLVIPREKLKILEQSNLGTPFLLCDFWSTSFHNKFTGIQLIFGNLTVEGSGSGARAVVDEDPKGWSGSSDFVLSVWIPSYCFVVADPHETQVGLGVHSTPAMVFALSSKLGVNMSVFSARVSDSMHVHVVPQNPYFSARSTDLGPSSPTITHERVSVALRDLKISTLAAKWEIGNLAGEDIQGEARSKQVSPCVIEVTLGKVSRLLMYPFPVNGEETKLRIARKSGWIEVVVPLSWHRHPGGFSIKNFPLLPCGDGTLTTWNMHCLNLQHLPTFNPRKDGADWVNAHIALGLSDRERSLRETSSAADVLVHVKDTIHALFCRATEPAARRIFGFTDPSGGGGYTLIFLNRLCFDLASATLVADTCILPLTHRLLNQHGQLIANLTLNGQMLSIVTKGEEVTAWKHLLPVFVERCRMWSHKSTCQYAETGKIPLSVEFAQNPICACGEGVDLGGFREVAKWKELAPFVTRAAFSQLFAVSYMESVAGALKDLGGTVDWLQTSDDDGGGGANRDVSVSSCARCGKGASGVGGRLMRCSRCTKTVYCGKNCQNADWHGHV